MDIIEEALYNMDLLDVYKLYKITMNNPMHSNVTEINKLMREKFAKHYNYEQFARKIIDDIDNINSYTKLNNLLGFFNQLQTGDIVQQNIGPKHIVCSHGASCYRSNPYHKVVSHEQHWTYPIIDKLRKKISKSSKKPYSKKGGKKQSKNLILKKLRKSKKLRKLRKTKKFRKNI